MRYFFKFFRCFYGYWFGLTFADTPGETPAKSFSQEEVTKMMEDTVKKTMTEIKKEEPESEPEPEPVPAIDNLNYPTPSESEPYYPEQPAEPNTPPPAPAYDPRVDKLAEQVRQGAIDNATNKFNSGWSDLVHQRPDLAEFTERANKNIGEMIKDGMITTPEKMAHAFMGEKVFNEAGALTPDPNVPASQVPASPGPTEEKPLKEMTDEEFAEWEDSHGDDKI